LKALPHIPESSVRNIPRRDYSPYPAGTADETLSRLLEPSRVRSVTAIFYTCTPRWRIDERRIGDDMFFYIVKGRGQVLVEGRKSVIRAGDCAHFRRGAEHSATTQPNDPIHVIALHYTATVFESLTIPDLLKFPDVFHLGTRTPILAMMNEACREYALQPAGWERGLEALVLRIILHLVHEHGDNLNLDPAPAGSLKLTELRRLLPALEAMRKNMDGSRRVGIPALARASGFSEAQFRRVFHRVMNMAPVQYLRRLRMEEACLLLRQTNETVESIADRVGYAGPAFFANSFRKLMGVSPGRYRATGL